MFKCGCWYVLVSMVSIDYIPTPHINKYLYFGLTISPEREFDLHIKKEEVGLSQKKHTNVQLVYWLLHLCGEDISIRFIIKIVLY